MADLSFLPYVKNAAGAYWQEVPHEVFANTWLWLPAGWPMVDQKELAAAGWIRAGNRLSEIGTSLYHLFGQLADVRFAEASEQDEFEVWARAQDWAHVSTTPVALAFSVPLNRYTPENMQVGRQIHIAQVLPPPQFGELALVQVQRGSAVAGWQRYSLDSLNDDARALQKRISDALQTLADNDGWQQWTARGQAPHAQLDPGWLEQWGEIQTMAQQLASAYWKARRRTLPDVPGVFGANALGLIPSAMPVGTILLGYSQAELVPEILGNDQIKEILPDANRIERSGWGRGEDDLPTFVQNTKLHRTALQIRPDEGITPDIRKLWEQVRQFDDLDGDVFLAELAQYLKTERDADGYVWITGPAILDYRGIEPRTSKGTAGKRWREGHRREDLVEIAQRAMRQHGVWVHIRSWIEQEPEPTKRSRRKPAKTERKLYNHESRLILIAEVIRQNELADLDEDLAQGPSFPIAWRYRMGTWLDKFIEGPNRTMAWLCQRALRYDPYHEKWEKRLARYAMIHLRINANGGDAKIARYVGKLLEELALDLDERNPVRTRERFERAMNRLVEDRLIAAWEYDSENSELPKRQWLRHWLGWKIHITADTLTSPRYAVPPGIIATHQDRSAMLRQLNADDPE